MPRPRTPTYLKALRGTLRADRQNPNEPQPEPRLPRPRRDLAESVRREYTRVQAALKALRAVVTLADAIALELLAYALAEHRAAVDVLLAKGHTYTTTTETGSVIERQRREVTIAADAWRRACTMLQQFGLTPASRSKVDAKPEEPADPLDAFALQRPRGARGR